MARKKSQGNKIAARRGRSGDGGGSSAGGEGDDFEAIAGRDEGVGVVAGEDGEFVEFDDDGFAGEVEEVEQAVEEDGIRDGMGRAVEGDGGL